MVYVFNESESAGMKKLGHSEQSPRLLRSRGNSRVLSAPSRAVFAAFGLNDYADASVPRIYDRPRSSMDPAPEADYPDNVIRFTTVRSSS
ncbi:MAG: hypothetical protein R3A46_07930 [Thermomicrobiales bacterium]